MSRHPHLHTPRPRQQQLLLEPQQLLRPGIIVFFERSRALGKRGTSIHRLVVLVKVQGVERDEQELVGDGFDGVVAASGEGVEMDLGDEVLPDGEELVGDGRGTGEHDVVGLQRGTSAQERERRATEKPTKISLLPILVTMGILPKVLRIRVAM